MRFFDRAEVKDMIAYLCLINNRSDDLRLMRIINTPAAGSAPRPLRWHSARQRLREFRSIK